MKRMKRSSSPKCVVPAVTGLVQAKGGATMVEYALLTQVKGGATAIEYGLIAAQRPLGNKVSWPPGSGDSSDG